MNLKFICAQPAIPYYLWQVEVLINNFVKWGIDPNNIHILLGVTENSNFEDWKTLQYHYSDVNFFFYEDTRIDSTYIPSIYFHLMKKHLAKHPKLQEEPLFLHDSDIIFTKKPEGWEDMLSGKTWYLGDTTSYINSKYILSKGEEIYTKMCEIVGIDPLIPKLLNSNSGGAQYLVKNTTSHFWNKVESDSIKIWRYLNSIEKDYQPKSKGDYPIQKWTAGMWSLLWNAWLSEHETLVDKRLGFSWSTDVIQQLDKYSILHNAGVTKDNVGLFYKGEFTKRLPYGEKLQISEDYCSSIYWKEICEVAKTSPLLINQS
jgi:hypothetical protein